MGQRGRVALVTGVGREEGLGFEVCRQLSQQGFSVLLTARDGMKASRLAEQLAREGDVHGIALDVTSDESVAAAAAEVARRGRLDALINNAADGFDPETRTVDADFAAIRIALETNLLGAWRLTRALLPYLLESDRGRVVNVSSEAGSFGPRGMPAGGATLPGYAVSKAALNAFTVKLAAALAGTRVRVNAVCPGFTATFAGAEAMGARPVRESARGLIWAATLGDDGPTGGFFRDGKPLSW